MTVQAETSRKPWIRFYDEGVPESIDYPATTLDALLRISATEHPSHPAIMFGGRVGSRIMDHSLTYQHLDSAVDQFAASLQELNLRPGDRVAIHLPNCPQFVIAFYGTLRAGGVAVPCNPLYAASELQHQLNDAGAEVLVTLSAFYEKVKTIRSQTGIRHIIVANIKDYFPAVLRLLFTLTREKKDGHRCELCSDCDDYWFESIVSGPPDTRPDSTDVDAESTACLLYTGGTTGVPKGAQLTHRNLLSNAMAGNVLAKTREADEVTIGALPLFHSYGLTSVMNMSIAKACTMVLIPDPRDVLHVMGAISKHRATLYPGVPTMYVAINHHPQAREFDLGSVRVCLSAAAPLPREVQEEFQTVTGGRLVEAYGLTEASPATHANPPYGRSKVGSIGLPLPDTDARIVDADAGEQELETGEIGELIISGPQVMKGYWQQPTETANVLRDHPDLGPGPWLHTGDIARMDEEGYFEIVDRKKDMIICGGYNVYPRDVEEVLYRHPGVQEAAVLGVPDEYRGETVMAFVVLKEGEAATAEEVIDFCGEHLARYKVPTAIEFRTELPKSAVGKVLRRELQGD